MVTTPLSHSQGRFKFRPESMKWLGLIAMLIDHVNIYVLSDQFPQAEFAGSLAFPLFAFALATGLADASHEIRFRVIYRLFIFGVIAEVARRLFVGESGELNILFTFGLGVLAYELGRGDTVGSFLLVVLCGVLGTVFVEYWAYGVLFVYALLVAVEARNSVILWCIAFVPMYAFYLFNDFNHWAWFAIPIALALSFLPDLPRIRGVFYWFYVIQFPVFFFVRSLLQ